MDDRDADGEQDDDASVPDDDEEDAPVGDTIAGTYWLRTEIEATASQPIIGDYKAQIDSTVTTYSLASISEDGGTYTMVDWQCHVTTTQVCKTTACSASETSTDEGHTHKPAKRTLTIQGSAWSTSGCAQSVGWDYDCTSDESAALPRETGDARINDAGGGKEGVDVFIKLNGDENHQCTFQAVQLVDVVYSGTLASEDRLNANGVTTDRGSAQNVIDSTSCGVDEGDIPSPMVTKPGKLRILAKSIPDGSSPTKWNCPSLEEFEAAFGK